MSQRIQLRRGQYADLPNSNMLAGEPHITMDRGTLHVAKDATTRIPVVPDIFALTNVAGVDGGADFFIMYDADAPAGEQKERKISFNALKTALNIPASDTDEKVATTSGVTAGYLWGSNGTDGVLRMGSSMSWQVGIDAVGYATIDVAVVDGGTF